MKPISCNFAATYNVCACAQSISNAGPRGSGGARPYKQCMHPGLGTMAPTYSRRGASHFRVEKLNVTIIFQERRTIPIKQGRDLGRGSCGLL